MRPVSKAPTVFGTPYPLMKLLLKVVGGLAALILALLLVAFFFPREYRVERVLAMKAKPETVLPLVADLRAWKSWARGRSAIRR